MLAPSPPLTEAVLDEVLEYLKSIDLEGAAATAEQRRTSERLRHRGAAEAGQCRSPQHV